MRAPRSGGEGWTLAALLLIAAVLFLFPLAQLAKVGLAPDGALTLGPVTEALSGRSVPRALWNSLESSALSAAIALCLGTSLALVVGLTDLRAKGAAVFLILIPMMIPPHVTAIAWAQALGPASPLLQALGVAPELGSTHPIYSREGVIGLLALQHAPLVFLVVLAALRALPREMSEAARIAGARPFTLLRRVILPLLAPTLIAAYGLAFVSALGNFGIPALLGVPARYITLPVLIWRKLASFGPDVLAEVAAISSLLAGVAVIVVAMQMAAQRRAAAPLIGPPQPPMRMALGRARPMVEGAVAFVIAATLILPVSALVSTALVPTYGVALSAETATLDNFAEVLGRQTVTTRAFVNSTLVAGAAGALLALFAALLARQFVTRRRGARLAGGGVATMAEVSYAIPGLVISIAFILAFLKPIPVIGVSLYGTLGIIFIAYLTAFFAVAAKPVTAAAQQIDPVLEEAARVAGAGYGRRLRRIFLPLVAPAMASGAILVFLTAYNEVTVSALLWSTGTETIGTTIFNYEDGGYTTLAAAMSAVTVVATVGLMFALDLAGRRAPPGVVPWRI